ncbi:molybdenum ABC transporter ATP-binding protein [Mesorhizobium sp. RP14(2022)]|uniref:Molybdenum ABC transporter ATP-binding protein n=1 Tax=Mesorhizobium liriopis TaxID=2953882 RepID=A0ABT1C6L1_9HYPH|nr:molybdenum ABC transporter ATP-binding protein [Mesorhizobium liriopis]MCO6049816.1 molybdenum ABC transporter ATP-binding protein [Mesorhizobium liriopis]
MSLEVSVQRAVSGFTLDATFASAGRLTALFGPSGSGKTMLINLISGLMRPDRGRIAIDNTVLVDTDARIAVPIYKRRIGYVFQDARLFPHLSVRQNLRFGRFFAPRTDRWADEAAIIDLLGIGHLLDRRPGMLSGGEKSRVAIGRALLASPRLLLMDEPLAALDDARKREILPFIERLRDELKVPIVYVSHSAQEVARLATDVVMMRDGRVLATGPAEAVLPRLDTLAEESGESSSLITLTVAEPMPEWGLTRLRSSGGEWRLARVQAAAGTKLRVRIRARDVMLSRLRPEQSSALNVLEGAVTAIAPLGEAEALVTLDCGGDAITARVTRLSADALELSPGTPVFAVVKSVSFDPASTAAIRGVPSADLLA